MGFIEVKFRSRQQDFNLDFNSLNLVCIFTHPKINFIACSSENIEDDRIFQSFMMGTPRRLTCQENINVISFMEIEILRMATEKHFKAVFTTNTNQLNQQVTESVLGYKTLREYQINKYVDKYGKKPFQNAKDFQKIRTQWKDIVEEQKLD